MNAFQERIETVKMLINKLDQGKLSQDELDTLVNSARELYERSIVLQYKAFEEKVFGSSKEIVAAAELTESVMEEPSTVVEELPESEQAPVQEEAPAFDFTLFDEPAAEDEPTSEPEPVKEEHVSVSHTVSEDNGVTEEELTIEKTSVSVDPDALSSAKIQLNRELEKHTSGHMLPRLDTMIGSFGLNERLQFINELFGGSSEDFAIAVSELDSAGSYNDALDVFAQMAMTKGWTSDSETVLDFLTKVKRRYA